MDDPIGSQSTASVRSYPDQRIFRSDGNRRHLHQRKQSPKTGRGRRQKSRNRCFGWPNPPVISCPPFRCAITLGGFLASAFAASNIASQYHKIHGGRRVYAFVGADAGYRKSTIVITIILSYFTLVLGELTPKRIAMQYPRKGRAAHQPRHHRRAGYLQADRMAAERFD